jgi:hypothetical protein
VVLVVSIDRNEGTDTTDCPPFECENGLEQRHAARKIASLFEPSGERRRRIGNGEGGDGQMVRRVHFVEPGRNACGGVPDEARGVIPAAMVVPLAAAAIATVASTMTRPVIASPACAAARRDVVSV